MLHAAEPLRAEHRSEREGARSGDHHHNADHPAQLAEEDAGHAGDERQREEHRYEGESGCYYGDGHLVGAVDGRLLRIGSAFDMGRDVFKHHDRVVDHHTDGYGERRERHDVERVAGSVEIDEGCDQRHRDGDDDDHRGAPASEEEEYDYHHEEERVEHRLLQRGDRSADIVGGVDDYAELDVGGKVFLKLREHLHDCFRNLH